MDNMENSSYHNDIIKGFDFNREDFKSPAKRNLMIGAEEADYVILADENVTSEEFENSKFAHEISKRFPVFIINFEDFKQNIIKDVKIISEFSFEIFNQDAKEVYNKTKDAFDKGDENAFVKSNDNLKFYVRINTSNDNETFEFSNGEQISRRTFAAKKETVKELLSKFQ